MKLEISTSLSFIPLIFSNKIVGIDSSIIWCCRRDLRSKKKSRLLTHENDNKNTYFAADKHSYI